MKTLQVPQLYTVSGTGPRDIVVTDSDSGATLFTGKVYGAGDVQIDLREILLPFITAGDYTSFLAGMQTDNGASIRTISVNGTSADTFLYDVDDKCVSDYPTSGRVTNRPLTTNTAGLARAVVGQRIFASGFNTSGTVNGNSVSLPDGHFSSYILDTTGMSQGTIISSLGSLQYILSLTACDVNGVYYYLNRLGGIDSVPVNMRRGYNGSAQTFTRTYAATSLMDRAMKQYHIRDYKEWNISTISLQEEADASDMIMSRKGWIHDLESGYIDAVYPAGPSWQQKRRRQGVVYYDATVRSANTYIR